MISRYQTKLYQDNRVTQHDTRTLLMSTDMLMEFANFAPRYASYVSKSYQT